MNALAYLVIAIAKMLHLIFTIYTFIIAAAVIMSWIKPDPHNPIVRIIRQVTEPVFNRVRRIMPRALFRTGLDFSPIIILLILILLDTVVVELLFDLGKSLF
jgi:YggT family protein